MPMVLTPENYHSIDANRQYLSVSQYLGFVGRDACEAQEMAKLDPEKPYAEPEKKEFLIGGYVHAHFEGNGALSRFTVEHPECFKKDGLKADFLHANVMIARAERDPFFVWVMEGEPEVIIVAEMFGAWWKIKIDRYNPGSVVPRFVDLKTCKSITEREWNKEERRWESWVEHWGYVTRFAIYAEVERLAKEQGNWLNGFIAALSKEQEPDIAIIRMTDPDRWADELMLVKNNLPRIMAVKSGQEPPMRCEKCVYCRQTKVLGGQVIPWRDL